ncbi:MAG: hypothetical protein WBA89_26865 [Microcoleus sp.]
MQKRCGGDVQTVSVLAQGERETGRLGEMETGRLGEMEREFQSFTGARNWVSTVLFVELPEIFVETRFLKSTKYLSINFSISPQRMIERSNVGCYIY